MIEVRRLTADDWADWRDLRLAALKDAPDAFTTQLGDWLDAGEERWRRRLTDVPLNLIAEVDGRPAGMAGATTPDESGATELISMWVAPFARGRGAGDALIEDIKRWAGEVGTGTTVLDVFEGNVHATALYRRHGFRGEGRRLEYHPESGDGA